MLDDESACNDYSLFIIAIAYSTHEYLSIIITHHIDILNINININIIVSSNDIVKYMVIRIRSKYYGYNFLLPL
jgi:hypothetical protein